MSASKQSMKPTLVIHANCQGEALLQLLQSHADVAANFECRLFTNYIREQVPDAILADCAVFLYQYLDETWGELASDRLLQKLGKNSQHLCIPNYYYRHYWPLLFGGGKHVLRDRLLEDLWKRKLNRDDFVHLATRSSLLSSYDLQGIVDQSLSHERAKEARTPIKYVDRILAGCGQERLFYSVNHPGEEILFFTVDEILTWMGFTSLPQGQAPVLDPSYTALELPVHPGLAEVFNLSWVEARTTYAVYGNQVTYAQFAWLYAEYRDSGIDNFIEFMGTFNVGQAA